MIILGICAYHGDSSACIISDGKLIAAVEEERFRRIKHWAGFPSEAIKYCLGEAGVSIGEVDHIAVARNPKANLHKKALFAFSRRPSFSLIKDRLANMGKIKNVKTVLSETLGVKDQEVRARFHNVEHHQAHMGSSFLVSMFDEAAILSVDGFGDFVSTMMGFGRKGKMDVLNTVIFPHSIGLFHTAITQYLGFMKYGDEFKVMGLASYGKPSYKKQFEKIIRYNGDGKFKLDLEYFVHHSEGVNMTWGAGEPKMGRVFSDKLIKEFGPSRQYDQEITEYHKNMAATLQVVTEELIFKILNNLYGRTGCKNLCLAGGVAMNSVANGKIFDNTPFEEVYIQSAAGDAGTALGAAYYVYNMVFQKPRDFVMETSYWGPGFTGTEISKEIRMRSKELSEKGCTIEKVEESNVLCKKTAEFIADGKVVGWFQGRMEWGPRALGNRSIVVDPRRAEMKEVLNERIKRREAFRPFAPSILLEATGDYFEIDYPDPFMLKVYKIKPEKKSAIPAVTHVDGTGRLQTVREKDNPLYWNLIKEFEKIAGVPVLLNTSFNENEPIVCFPKEALECFLRTKMDVLVIENYIIERHHKGK